MKNRPKWILTAVIGVAVFVGAGILGIGITQFVQYRSSSIPIYPIPDQAQVTITSPVSGSQHTIGSPILIQVTATGPEEIEEVELFINSKLVGVDPAPPGGSHLYQAEFLWSPPEEGVYILIARVDEFELFSAYSPSVQIEAVNAENAQEAGDIFDSPAPVSGFPDPSSNIPIPESPPEPADDWKGSPGNWINSLTADNPPQAPQLAAAITGCSVTLSIQDLSDNEEGFEVWRLLPNSPTWKRIAVLASQSQQEWIAFTDSSAHGATSYYVSAFNSQGIKNSNLVQVNLDPGDCAPSSAPGKVLSIQFEEIEFEFPIDKFYCYFSLDGDYWSRKPVIGFWPGGNPSQEEKKFETEIVSMNLQGEGPIPGLEIDPVVFYLDCWGWAGGSLKFLGAFTETLGPNQKGEVQVGSEGVSAVFALNIKKLPDQPEFYPMGGSWSSIGVFDDSMEEIPITNPLFKAQPIEPSMPWINAFITDVPGSCQDHLPPQYQNENDMTFFCYPSDGFNYGPNGPNPQPYLNWDPNGVPRCPNGQGPQCKSYYYWLSLAADLGHEVGFNVYDNNSKGFRIKPVTVEELFNYTIRPVPCSGTRELWVQMWYYDGTSLLPTYGPPSNKVSIPCPVALGPKMFLDVRFDQVVFSGLEDDESAPQDIEAFGYLRASSESMTRYLNLASWQSFVSFCPDEDGLINNQTSSQPGCPLSFMDGIHNLIDLPLCRSEQYHSCTDSGWDHNNNTLRLVMEDGDSLTVSAKILDLDSAAASDLVCEGTIQFPGKKILDWHNMKDEVFIIQGSSTNSGTCHIFGTLNAVSP